MVDATGKLGNHEFDGTFRHAVKDARWNDLAEELLCWHREGRAPTFWWRDDDAASNTPALGRLLDLRNNLDVPLALAAVPAQIEDSLADALGYTSHTSILQHGWSHRNYGPASGRKIELGGGRAPWDILSELAMGRRRLLELVEPVLLPVLVPPYNAIEVDLIPALANIGFRGISTWSARPGRSPVPGLVQANVHIDIIDWSGTRGFVGDETALGQAISHLSARRFGTVDPEEPTGLNTHHLAQDEGGWQFVRRFIRETRSAGATWLSAAAAFDLCENRDGNIRMQERMLRIGPPCNVCGGVIYGLGPHARKAFGNPDRNPSCARCHSMERHRAIRSLYNLLPQECLEWRRTIFFASDPALSATWFREFETSEYGGTNSIDLQDIGRPDGRYDLVALNQTIEMVPDDRKAFDELLRICSDRGVLQITFLTDLKSAASEHYAEPQPPHGWMHLYGRDLFDRFRPEDAGFHVACARATDTVTGYVQRVFFLFRSSTDRDEWVGHWRSSNVDVSVGSLVPA